MRKTYKFRLYPSSHQIALLGITLRLCRELYNAGLQERRDAYQMARVSLDYNDQSNQLPEIKQLRPDLNAVHSQVLQDVLRRLDKSFKAFFRRVRNGETPGFPRFKSANRFDSFCYPQGGFGIENDKLRLSKIGSVKIKLHRPIEGRIKTCTIKREAGKWYACFSVESIAEPLPIINETVGIDVGLSSFAVLSDGSEIDNPRHYENAQRKLRVAQRRVARRKKGGNRRRKAVTILQKAHAYIKNQRADFHHKVSRTIVNNFGSIFVEDLNVKGLAAGMLAKQVNDAGWSSFINKLAYKAENAGRRLMTVDPRGTSQRCPCGNPVPKTLKDRWHHCDACGLSVSRDHASAMEIERLGLSLLALTCPAGECVVSEAPRL